MVLLENLFALSVFDEALKIASGQHVELALGELSGQTPFLQNGEVLCCLGELPAKGPRRRCGRPGCLPQDRHPVLAGLRPPDQITPRTSPIIPGIRDITVADVAVAGGCVCPLRTAASSSSYMDEAVPIPTPATTAAWPPVWNPVWCPGATSWPVWTMCSNAVLVKGDMLGDVVFLRQGARASCPPQKLAPWWPMWWMPSRTAPSGANASLKDIASQCRGRVPKLVGAF